MAPGPFREVLISSDRRVEHLEINSEDGTPGAAPWSVVKSTLHGGRQEGVELIAVDGGELRFTVAPTRGMGILEVFCGDVRLGWDSPVSEVVHPRHVDLNGRGGLGWLEGFNEWLVRCGLEWAGAPGVDRFVSNTGDESEMDLSLHGKIANTPANDVELEVDDRTHGITVRGHVREASFYGPNLSLDSAVSHTPGSARLSVRDRVTNLGGSEQELQLIYHINQGPPVLGAGSRFAAPMRRVTPINEHAAKAVAGMAEYAEPTPGFVEEVFCVHPLADEAGRSGALLHNAAADRGVWLEFAVDQLPYLTLWKSTGAVQDGYVTGIEPGTGFPRHRAVEREHGRVPVLGPGESRDFALDVEVLREGRQVAAALDRIAAIQAGRRVQIDERP